METEVQQEDVDVLIVDNHSHDELSDVGEGEEPVPEAEDDDLVISPEDEETPEENELPGEEGAEELGDEYEIELESKHTLSKHKKNSMSKLSKSSQSTGVGVSKKASLRRSSYRNHRSSRELFNTFVDLKAMRDYLTETVHSLLPGSEKKAAVDLERAVYNHSVRKGRETLNQNTSCRVPSCRSPSFNKEYYYTVFTDICGKIIMKRSSVSTLINELKRDITGYSSEVYRTEGTAAFNELTNIKNPPKVEKGIHRCNKCKGTETLSYQVQLRSADEPMTTFVKCVGCGKQWKE